MADYRSVLSQEILTGCAENAGANDRNNTFFTEDFERLKDAGYLKGPIPAEFGGAGLNLLQSCQELLAHISTP